jgi:hypothetical protein
MHRLDPVAGIYADGGTGVKVTLARPRRDGQCRTLDTAHAVPSPWGGGAGLVFQRPGGTAQNGLYVAHRGPGGRNQAGLAASRRAGVCDESMDQFIAKHADKLQGTPSCFDGGVAPGGVPVLRWLRDGQPPGHPRDSPPRCETLRADSSLPPRGSHAEDGGTRGPALPVHSGSAHAQKSWPASWPRALGSASRWFVSSRLSSHAAPTRSDGARVGLHSVAPAQVSEPLLLFCGPRFPIRAGKIASPFPEGSVKDER